MTLWNIWICPYVSVHFPFNVNLLTPFELSLDMLALDIMNEPSVDVFAELIDVLVVAATPVVIALPEESLTASIKLLVYFQLT